MYEIRKVKTSNIFTSMLAGSGACSVAVKKAYPRCGLSILDKSQFRLEQCRRQLLAVDTNFRVESEYNTEVCPVVCWYLLNK